MHVTARAVRGVPHFRYQRVFTVIRAVLARSSEKGLRVLHFSVQGNHLHLIVEAEDGGALGRGMQRLLSRVAMAVNAVTRRSGKVWSDRYHRQDLTSPSQLRNAYVYVLFNIRKHATTDEELALMQDSLDPCSSARWFNRWAPRAGPDPAQLATAGPPIVASPRTWLAREGWERGGLLHMNEQPRKAHAWLLR